MNRKLWLYLLFSALLTAKGFSFTQSTPGKELAIQDIIQCFDQVNYGVASLQPTVLLDQLDKYSLQQIQAMFKMVKSGKAKDLGELEYYYCIALKRSHYLWDDETREKITFPEFITHFFSTLYAEYSHPFKQLRERISLYEVELVDNVTAFGKGVGGGHQIYEKLTFSKEGEQWKFNLFSILDRPKNVTCDLTKNGWTNHMFIYNSRPTAGLVLPKASVSEEVANRAIVVTNEDQLLGLPKLYVPADIKAMKVAFNSAGLEDGNLISALSNYENLEYLNLQIGTDPLDTNTIKEHIGPYLGQLKKLRTLIIQHALPVIPEELGALKNLEQLAIYCRKLDQFPTTILKLQQLRTLRLHENRFRSIPAEISRLKNLETLDIGSLCELPHEFNQLAQLKHLSVYLNKVEDIEIIGQMTSLKKLDLITNGGLETPAPLSKLRQLNSLSISILGNLDGLENFKSLEHLSLMGGRVLAPENLEVIGKLKKLRSLRLADIYPLQRLPSFIEKLPRLEHLSIRAAELTSLDISCKTLKRLKSVKFSSKDYSKFPLKLCGAPVIIFDPRYRLRSLVNNEISRWHLAAQNLQTSYTRKVQEYMRANRQALNIERGRERRAKSLLKYFRFDYNYDKESYLNPIRLELALKESVQYDDVEELVGILKQYNEEILATKKKFGLEGSYW